MRRTSEKGQAILLVVVAMGIFLVGALGLAIDSAQLYGHRVMAQVAADAAAQAAILSVFNATNVDANDFASSSGYTHTCSTSDPIAPCRHARENGFGGTDDDIVYIDIPAAADVGMDPASLSSTDPVNLIRVTITRHVPAGIIRMLGAASTTDVKAVAVAAIVGVQSATPMLITHPNLENALSTNATGNPTTIQICGGPPKSIQINSSAATAYNTGGTIDLSHAGPDDPGDCSTGTGADFGVFGGPVTNPGKVSLGTSGHYISPSSVILDPLRSIPAPAVPGAAASPFTVNVSDSPNYGCASTCTVYSPGLYVGGLNVSGGQPIIFKPGLYYMQGGGFKLKNVDGGGGAANEWNAMCAGCAPDADTGMGMVVYDTGPVGSHASGGFDINTLVHVSLQGSTLTTTNASGQIVPAAPYYGILFWEDREAVAHTGNDSHSLGQGNGCFTVAGTIYITNTLGIMSVPPYDHYQAVTYNGTPCSTTVQQGDIIVSALIVKGGTTIKMKLLPYGFLTVRQVALVR